jgi:hypothetical protein
MAHCPSEVIISHNGTGWGMAVKQEGHAASDKDIAMSIAAYALCRMAEQRGRIKYGTIWTPA